MKIIDLIKQCEVRLEYLKNMRHSYVQQAEHDLINKVDSEILELEETINKLKNN